MDVDLFETWFRIADEDRDNAIAGAEAVKFFQRSNLSQETLFKIWNLVAGDRPALSRPQFFSTMRLISLAQRSGGVLEDGPARSTLIGMGPPLPPPTMAGLEVPKAMVSQQSWQSAPQIPGASNAAFSAANLGPPAPQASGGFPPVQPQELQNYRSMFAQLDSNRDGYVTGAECYESFLAWNLPKNVLKDIWAAVAGDNGELSQQQFIACLYLMDLARKGIPPPAQLPPGPFPPIATPTGPTASSAADFSLSQHDVFSRDLPMPEIPGKVAFSAPPAPGFRSAAPVIDPSALAGLEPLERQRLQNEQQQAKEMEEKLHLCVCVSPNSGHERRGVGACSRGAVPKSASRADALPQPHVCRAAAGPGAVRARDGGR